MRVTVDDFWQRFCGGVLAGVIVHEHADGRIRLCEILRFVEYVTHDAVFGRRAVHELRGLTVTGKDIQIEVLIAALEHRAGKRLADFGIVIADGETAAGQNA